MTSISGLASGLDTNSIVNQLMQLERRPQVALTQRRDAEESARTELSEIRSDISALRNQAADLRLTSGWDQLSATSSNPDAVSVTASSSSTTGTYSFRVTQTAQAASVYSNEVYASLEDTTGAAGPSVFSSSGHQALGFSTFQGQNFPDGPVTVEVVQASGAAKAVGGIPTIPITVDGTNDSIDLDVNGFSFTVTIDHGTYDTEQGMANALQAALSGHAQASSLARASLNGSNQIEFSTIAEGSDHGITVIGGSLMADLGFTLGAGGTGSNAVVEVNGVTNTITDIQAGTNVTLNSDGAGTIDATLSGGVSAGTITASQSSGSGGAGGATLQELVNQVNDADLGYTAFAVNTGAGYRLQLTANETGAASTIDTGDGSFGGMTFTQLSAGQDAILTVDGDTPLTITSSDNTFDELLPGATITVHDTTDTAVTVSTERDVEAVADVMDELVTKVNDLFNRVASSTSNDPGSQAVLRGNREARRAVDELRNALVDQVEDNSFGSVGMAGIELTREGGINFNRSEFIEALTADPDALTGLFTDRSADGSGPPGAIDRLIEAAETATNTGTGYLYTAGEAFETRIDNYSNQIDSFERRMELRESTLRRTYANLEVALSGMQQQSSWLSAQLGSLGGGSIL